MWIVVKDYYVYEIDVTEFSNEDEAREFYESWVDDTSATMYLARVENKKDSTN